MSDIEQIIDALKSVETYLRNQELSEIGRQVQGKVIEALKKGQTLTIDSVSCCYDDKYTIEQLGNNIWEVIQPEEGETYFEGSLDDCEKWIVENN